MATQDQTEPFGETLNAPRKHYDDDDLYSVNWKVEIMGETHDLSFTFLVRELRNTDDLAGLVGKEVKRLYETIGQQVVTPALIDHITRNVGIDG